MAKKPVSDRGNYRGIHRALIDGKDFQLLPERARWLFVLMKLGAGPVGIEVEYDRALAEKLSQRSGASPKRIRSCLDLLERGQWIARESNVVWIVGHLTFEPSIHHSDPKHRLSVQRHVAGLPRLSIVRKFVAAHPEWFPKEEVEAVGLGWTLRSPLEGPSETPRSTDNGKRITETRTDTDNGDGKGAPPPPPPSVPSVRSTESEKGNSTAAAEFEAAFYATATPKRLADVRRQLAQTQTPKGARLRKGVLVRARDAHHLAAVLRSVIDDPPQNPDMAIVFVLEKLNQPLPAVVPDAKSTAGDAERRRLEQLYLAEKAGAVDAWLASPDNAEKRAGITSAVEAEFAGNAFALKTAVPDQVRVRVAEVIGFPAFDAWLTRPVHTGNDVKGEPPSGERRAG